MQYCKFCGYQLNDDAPLCPSCGKPTRDVSQQEGIRRVIFEGGQYKCPYCGDPVDAFEFVCGACGKDIRRTDNFDQFLQKLASYSDVQQKEKSYCIKTYIPSSKKDVISFLTVSLQYIDDDNAFLAKAWQDKAESLSQSAAQNLAKDADFVDAVNQLNVKITRLEQRAEQQLQLQKAQQRREKLKKNAPKIITYSIIVLLVLVAIIVYWGVNNLRKIGDSPKSFVGKNYNEVVTTLKQKDFTNIQLVEIQCEEKIANDGQIISVSIGGKKDFNYKNWFNKNTEIVIEHYVNDWRQIADSSEEFIGKDYEIILKQLKNLGFIHIELEEILCDEKVANDGLIYEILIDKKTEFDAQEWFNKNVKIKVRYYVNNWRQITYTNEYFKGKDYNEIANLLKELGFTNIELKENNWYFGSGNKHTVKEVVIDGERDFEKGEWFDKAVNIVITYFSPLIEIN